MKLRLSAKINLIFSVVTIIVGIVFLIIIETTSQNEQRQLNRLQLLSFYNDVVNGVNNQTSNDWTFLNHDFNGVIVFNQNQNGIIQFRFASMPFFGIDDANLILNASLNNLSVMPYRAYFNEVNIKGVSLTQFIFTDGWSANQYTRVIIVFVDHSYINSLPNLLPMVTRLSFLGLLMFGNVIIWYLSKSLVDRIKRISKQVGSMDNQGTLNLIKIEGHDELSDLAIEINNMRNKIKENEDTKEMMIHNISHDFKTPITVIRSYAEAIFDEVATNKDAQIIINQTSKLEKKVNQLLSLNKANYLKENSRFDKVALKPIITEILEDFKYTRDLEIHLNLEEVYYDGFEESYQIIVNNLVENAYRFAKTNIAITLKNNLFSIFNDGPPIADDFIINGFKLYEKGINGQFGIGMSIVSQISQLFELKLEVKNLKKGVIFTLIKSDHNKHIEDI